MNVGSRSRTDPTGSPLTSTAQPRTGAPGPGEELLGGRVGRSAGGRERKNAGGGAGLPAAQLTANLARGGQVPHEAA